LRRTASVISYKYLLKFINFQILSIEVWTGSSGDEPLKQELKLK
jgi:hypothetical protein